MAQVFNKRIFTIKEHLKIMNHAAKGFGILMYVKKHKLFDKKFKENTVLVDNLRGKSGTLTGIKSYGGYMYNVDEDLLAFSIIINHHGMSGSAVSEKLEEVMESIYYLK